MTATSKMEEDMEKASSITPMAIATMASLWMGANTARAHTFFATGDRYRGSFVDDEMTGFGTYYSFDGGRYEGEHKDGRRHGFGTYYALDGTATEGEWVESAPVGIEAIEDGAMADAQPPLQEQMVDIEMRQEVPQEAQVPLQEEVQQEVQQEVPQEVPLPAPEELPPQEAPQEVPQEAPQEMQQAKESEILEV